MRLDWKYLLAVAFTGAAAESYADSESLGESVTALDPSHEPPKLFSSGNIRDIKWGQVNFLHTTDTHGWLPGHLLEPEFSADWGDYVSFVANMRRLADDKGVDLLVVDTGDRHDGNGLSDATYPDGEISQRVFMNMDFDVITVGNHELYKAEVTEQEYRLLSPYYGDRYIASNVDILLPNGTYVPMGQRYHVFHTKNQNLKVLALGFLFNFRGNDWNSRVTLVEDAVQQDWFQEAIRIPDIDLIVLSGHTPVRFFKEFDVIIKEIRTHLPTTPIQALGGHTHIRDYRVYDNYATGIESGRFLETVGWASFDLAEPVVAAQQPEFTDITSWTNVLNFSRSYIDFNVQSLAKHAEKLDAGTVNSSFYTERGNATSQAISLYRDSLNLTEYICCVDKTYYTTRAKYPGDDSLFSLIEDDVLPLLEGSGELATRAQLPRYIIINTGSIRFDLFAGPFTKDTGFIVSPFNNGWLYIPDVPVSVAKHILPLLNQEGSILSELDAEITHNSNADIDFKDLGLPSERGHNHESVQHLGFVHQFQDGHGAYSKLSGGYVTNDDMGSDGDDTKHEVWPIFDIPNAIQAKDNVDDKTTHVDVIFYDFMKPFILHVLDTLRQTDLAFGIAEYGGPVLVELLPQVFSTEGCEKQ